MRRRSLGLLPDASHVPLVLVPKDDMGLSRAIGAAHRRYTHFINLRGRWTGHPFQSRFASLAMDESHLMAAVRYVRLDPARVGLAARAQDRPWSSVRAHLKKEDDALVAVAPVLARFPDFPALIADRAEHGFGAPRTAEVSGRPLGNAEFIAGLERILARRIAPRGRKPNSADDRQIKLL